MKHVERYEGTGRVQKIQLQIKMRTHADFGRFGSGLGAVKHCWLNGTSQTLQFRMPKSSDDEYMAWQVSRMYLQ